MKLERILEIIIYLLNHEKVSAKYLAEYFNVSVRTIQRDMASIAEAELAYYKTCIDIEIVFDEKKFHSSKNIFPIPLSKNILPKNAKPIFMFLQRNVYGRLSSSALEIK